MIIFIKKTLSAFFIKRFFINIINNINKKALNKKSVKRFFFMKKKALVNKKPL